MTVNDIICKMITYSNGNKHDIAHFPVGKFDHIVVNEHAVCGQGKSEIFIVLFFNAAGIFDKFFDHIKVHERLAAEKVNL